MSVAVPAMTGLRVASISALLLTACVPAAEDPPPRGAAGIKVEPSGAARGEPFVTADGWTLRFERLAVFGEVMATTDEDHYGQPRRLLFNGAVPAESFVPALPPGAWDVDFHLVSVDWMTSDAPPDYEGEIVTVDPATAATFMRPPDNVVLDSRICSSPSNFGGCVIVGPSIAFAVHAEKGGEVMTLDLSLSQLGAKVQAQPVVVRANDVAFASVDLAPERLFSPTTTGEALVFDDIAQADRLGDRDGRISADELRQLHTRVMVSGGDWIPSSIPVASSCDPGREAGNCMSMMALLVQRTSGVIVRP